MSYYKHVLRVITLNYIDFCWNSCCKMEMNRNVSLIMAIVCFLGSFVEYRGDSPTAAKKTFDIWK